MVVFCLVKIAIASVFPPYRGGIAQFNEALAAALHSAGHDSMGFNFSRQYPKLLFPGTQQIETGTDSAFASVGMIDSINPLSWKRSARKIIAWGPDILILPFWTAFLAPSLASLARTAKALDPSLRVVGLFHNANSHDARWFEQTLTRALVRRVDQAWTLSKDVSNRLQEINPNLPIITGFHPLYDHFQPLDNQQDARMQLGLSNKGKVVLFFGLIRPYKGLDMLLKAAIALMHSGEDLQVCIAGEPYEPWTTYQQIIDASPFSSRFALHLKFIPQDQVHTYFSASDLVCLPYKAASQSGVTAIAMHYHKPVVATNVGGLKEYFEGSPIGYLSEPDDLESLIEAIRTALHAQPAQSEDIMAWNHSFSWEAFVLKCLSPQPRK